MVVDTTTDNNSNFSLHNPEDGLFTMLWNKYVILNKALSDREMRMLSVFLSLTKEIEFDNKFNGDTKKKFFKQDVYQYCAKSPTTNDRTFRSLKLKGHIKQIRRINQDSNTLIWCYEIYQKPIEKPVEQYITQYIYDGKVYDTPVFVEPKVKPQPPAQEQNIDAIAAEFPDIDPAVLAAIAAKFTATPTAPTAQAEAPAPVHTEGVSEKVVVSEKTVGFFERLKADTAAQQEAVTKWELNHEELEKHLENFEKAKTSHHKQYDDYKKHFTAYCGKMLENVRKVLRERKKAEATATKKTKAFTSTTKTIDVPVSLDDDTIYKKSQEEWRNMAQAKSQKNWEGFIPHRDEFLQYAEYAVKRGIANEVLKSEYSYFKDLKNQGETKDWFTGKITAPTPSREYLAKSMKNIGTGGTKQGGEPPPEPSPPS